MVKGLLVKEYNRGFTADMFAVAGFAQPGVNIRYPSVITFFGMDILFYIVMVMAIKA